MNATTMITSVRLPMSVATGNYMIARLPALGFDVKVEGARRTAFGVTLERFTLVTVTVPEGHAPARREALMRALADFARESGVIA